MRNVLNDIKVYSLSRDETLDTKGLSELSDDLLFKDSSAKKRNASRD